jgi:hypothetical protein
MTLDADSSGPADQRGVSLMAGRRGLLRNAGIGAALAGAFAVGMKPETAAAQTITDADILNFALNLEYLEAEFYLNAVYGYGLSHAESTGVGGTPGHVNGGGKVNFQDKYVREYAFEIANDEKNHVLFLRSALGSAAVARPTIDLDQSFTTLARAAGIVGPNGTWNPFVDDNSFLIGAYIFEDVGVTAYHGAAASIANPAYLTAAAGILAVEAYHAAEVRLQMLQRGLASFADKISVLRAALSGAQDDQGVIYKGHANVVPTDANSIAFARTPEQVLNVVYGGGAGSDYLFYPNKMNGAIS